MCFVFNAYNIACKALSCRNSYFPSSCSSLVYLADMHGIYKSNVPLLTKKTSFQVKPCKIETVLISRSAQAAKLKKTYI